MKTRVNLDVSTWQEDPGDEEGGPWSYRGTTGGMVNRAYISNSDYDYGYRGMETDLTPPFYVVYAEYMTGDTFGSDYEACIVGIVKTADEANALLEEAEEFNGFGSLSNGFCVRWNGYFEHLLGLHYEQVDKSTSKHKRY